MAHTKRKRTRKHRGTPAGTIERAGRTGRPQTRQDAKNIARQRRQERLNKPPTWKGAINRAALAALVFGALVAFLQNPAQGAILGVVMFFFYIPLGYATDTMIYRFRMRKKQQAP